MKQALIFILSLGLCLTAKAQNTINGSITNGIMQPVQNARVILFNGDTTFFEETRSALTGSYAFANVPSGSYTLGVAKEGMDYLDTLLNLSTSLASLNFSLQAETHPGEWNILLN